MANPDVTTYFDPPDPNQVPLNLTQLFALATLLVHSEIQGDEFNTYIMQNTEPDADQHDKVWIQLDSQGRPLALKTWWAGGGGHWRRIYNGMLSEIRGFSGDPGYGAFPKYFDVNGLGNIGGEYDGWGICNGKGGRPDLSNKFLCSGNLDNTGGQGYDSGWQTLVTPGGEPNAPPALMTKGGGQWWETLKPESIPTPDTEAQAIVYRWTATGNDQDNSGPLYGLINSGATPHPLIPATTGNSNPKAVFTAPPFYSLAYIIFVGYAP